MSIYRFIEAEKGRFPIKLMCTTRGVSNSGFRANQGAAEIGACDRNEILLEKIVDVHAASYGTYGPPRVQC